MSFITIANSFKGRGAVFFKLDERMVDLLTFLIYIVMKQFCEFISFSWEKLNETFDSFTPKFGRRGE